MATQSQDAPGLSQLLVDPLSARATEEPQREGLMDPSGAEINWTDYILVGHALCRNGSRATRRRQEWLPQVVLSSDEKRQSDCLGSEAKVVCVSLST